MQQADLAKVLISSHNAAVSCLSIDDSSIVVSVLGLREFSLPVSCVFKRKRMDVHANLTSCGEAILSANQDANHTMSMCQETCKWKSFDE